MAINVCGSSTDILAQHLWVLSLLVLNYKMLEFCPKSLHENEHIFGIMHNLTYISMSQYLMHMAVSRA